MKDLQDVRNAREVLNFEVAALLRRKGWKHSSDNPACLWLFEKRLRDGRVVLVNADAALQFQDAIDAGLDDERGPEGGK